MRLQLIPIGGAAVVIGELIGMAVFDAYSYRLPESDGILDVKAIHRILAFPTPVRIP